MKLYFLIIGIANVIVAGINILLKTASFYNVIAATVLCTAAQFLLDGSVAIGIKMMPDRFFGVNNPMYKVTEAEKNLYKMLRVRLWKDKIWELGGIGGFSKKKLLDPKSPQYIEKFIIECNKGVLTHRLSYPIGFLVMLFLPKAYAISIACPIAAVNMFLNILPTVVLRYNTPKLQLMLNRIRSKNELK